jgi:hypothetical protein
VIWDFTGGSTYSISTGTGVFNGTIIAPGLSSVTIGGVMNGELFANKITLNSGSTVNGLTPEPSTAFLIGGALVGVGLLSKRLRTRPGRG